MKVLVLSRNDRGFALLEVLVALAIMAIVGLMAWRGMDVMVRGSETIERRSNQDALYFRLVQQFDRDCREILSAQELRSAPIAYGQKNIWWLRHYRVDGNDAWLLLGYGMGAAGLQRWTSRMLTNRIELDAQWAGISKDPDLIATNLQSSLEIPEITQQVFTVGLLPGTAGAEVNRGITMEWWVRGTLFPITRSCLIGSSL